MSEDRMSSLPEHTIDIIYLSQVMKLPWVSHFEPSITCHLTVYDKFIVLTLAITIDAGTVENMHGRNVTGRCRAQESGGQQLVGGGGSFAGPRPAQGGLPFQSVHSGDHDRSIGASVHKLPIL